MQNVAVGPVTPWRFFFVHAYAYINVLYAYLCIRVGILCAFMLSAAQSHAIGMFAAKRGAFMHLHLQQQQQQHQGAGVIVVVAMAAMLLLVV